MTTTGQYTIQRALTGELSDPASPVRQFLDTRFTPGLREVQRRYREAAPQLVLPAAPRDEVNVGTIGTAADWLMRFMVCPRPHLGLAYAGAESFALHAADASGGFPDFALLAALDDLVASLGYALDDRGHRTFDGPLPPNPADPEHLGRACWALALLSEVYRGGAIVAAAGPLARFGTTVPSAEHLLALVPPAALDQLRRFREIFTSSLLPALAGRHGLWAPGPVFTASQLMNGDADLIAGGLLLDLKTSSKKVSLAVTDLFQVIGYALMDYDDQFAIGSAGLFSARYGYLVTWELGALLDELAGREMSLATVRAQFRQLLHGNAIPQRLAVYKEPFTPAD